MPRELKTIVCGTDFSEHANHALDYALRFAKTAGGTLVVVHVIHVPAGDLFGPETHSPIGALKFEEVRKWSLDQLEEVHRTRLESYPKCELTVVIGDPSSEVLAVAQARKADLIVTATHGRSGLAHLVMGSVAEKIIRHAPCPVLVVRQGVE